MVKISVIVPVYNVEQYLEKCINSVLQQSFSEYEIIIINDGATDGSGEIAERMKTQYPEKIRVIVQENKGLGGARNTGIENAAGEYLFFLDSDDYIAEETLLELNEVAEKTGAELIIFDAQMVMEDGRKVGECIGTHRLGEFSLKSYPQLLGELPGAWNKLYKKDLFLDHNIRYPNKLWYEDIHTTLKIYLHTDKIYGIRGQYYYYLQREGSIMQSRNCERVLEMCNAIQTVVDYYKEQGVFEKYKEELGHMAFLHEFMWSIRRVNLANWKSQVQNKLRDHFRLNFPDYHESAYFRKLDRNDRIIVKLIEMGYYGVLNQIYKYSNWKKEWRGRKND